MLIVGAAEFFNAEPYFTFTEGMLSLDPDALLPALVTANVGRGTAEWAPCTRQTAPREIFGVSANVSSPRHSACWQALGPVPVPYMPSRQIVMGLLISPMVDAPSSYLPQGMFLLLFRDRDSGRTHLSLILGPCGPSGLPFVVITVDGKPCPGFRTPTFHGPPRGLGAGPIVHLQGACSCPSSLPG